MTPTAPGEDAVQIEYRFRVADGRVYRAVLEIDPASGESRVEPRTAWPEWVALDYQQCPDCPLDKSASSCCPVAQRLLPLVDIANSLCSYDAVEVEVLTAERRVLHATTAQRGMSALLGVVMATGGCPVLDRFKPMARFHLPFATEDETAYRAVSMYLLARYLADGRYEGDAVAELRALYADVQRVNLAIAARLRHACGRDAALNGLALLDLFAKGVPQAAEELFERLRPLFSAYAPRRRG